MPKSVHIIWDRFSCQHEKLSDIMWTWSKFHVCYQFLDTYENPGRKTFINPSCPKHPKIINWNKKWQIFIFILPCGASERFHLFEAPKRSMKIEKFVIFLPYFKLGWQGLRLCFCQTPDLCYFCFLNNRNT